MLKKIIKSSAIPYICLIVKKFIKKYAKKGKIYMKNSIKNQMKNFIKTHIIFLQISCWCNIIFFAFSCQENTTYKEVDNGLGVGNRGENRNNIEKKKMENPSQVIKFYDKTGRVQISTEISKKEAFIKYDVGKKYIIGRFENDKSPIYFDEKGDILAKITFLDKGLIIKNNSNQPIYWVKETEKAFQIADNQRLKNAFEIRKEKNLVRLYSPTKMLAELRLEDKKIILKGYDIYEIRDFAEKEINPALAIILLNDIPEYLRFIILVEMIR